MKIARVVDIDVSVGESRRLRIQEEVEFDISAEEAAAAVLGDNSLGRVLNGFAAFLKNVSDAEIDERSPEFRRTVATFLESAARRFDEKEPMSSIGAAAL